MFTGLSTLVDRLVYKGWFNGRVLDKTSKIIQEKISKQNFDTWIKPIKIVAMEDQCVQLAVPNKFFKDWLVDNYCSTIKQSLKDAAGLRSI